MNKSYNTTNKRINNTNNNRDLSGYKSVRKRELTSVDFPKPDSPTTIRVNSNLEKKEEG